MITSLAALGLPGLAGFAGELLILTGVYAAGFWWVALIALVAIVIAAGYMLRLFQGSCTVPSAPICRSATISRGPRGRARAARARAALAGRAIRTRSPRGSPLSPAINFGAFATQADVGALLPATIVALTALVAVFFDLLAPAATRRLLAVAVAAIGLVAAGIVLAQQYGHPYAAFGGAFLLGGFSSSSRRSS